MSEQNQPEKQEKKPEKKNFQHHMAVPGKKGIIYTIARGIFWIYFHLFCFMHCTGREKLNLDAPYIVIANHTSFADPIIAAMLIRRYEVNFLGKIELAKAPVVGKLLMHMHMIPVDLRGAAWPHHRNLPRADGTPGGVNTKICVKSCFFALFSRTKNFFKKIAKEAGKSEDM